VRATTLSVDSRNTTLETAVSMFRIICQCIIIVPHLTYSIMVFKAAGYLITWDQARKLVPAVPPMGGLGAFYKWLEATKLNQIVTPMSVRWFVGATDELDDFVLLARVSRDDPKSTREDFSPFVETIGDREVKSALEKLLGETISEFTTIPDPHDEEC
jgi:hypothetical protein